MRPIRTYAVTVEDHGTHPYSARSPGKARAAAWRDYTNCYDCSFRHFLTISTCRIIPNPGKVGERIMVGGQPATRVIGYGQYVHFMRDDSDMILCSHPLDVTPFTETAAP